MNKLNIYVIGPMNTGTNLTNKIIKDCNCINKNGDKINISEYKKNEFFKHTTNINVINKYLENPNNFLIVMYKNVYNWIFSMKKESYELKFTKLNNFVELDGVKFPNIIKLYNHYYNMYKSLLSRNNVIFFDYIKIINKENAFQYINTKLNKFNLSITLKEKFTETLNNPSKNHGHSVNNSDEAIQMYSSNQNIVKNFLIKYTKIHNNIDNNLTNFYTNNT